MIKKIFQKIRRWWRVRRELIEEVERYEEELERYEENVKNGTLIRGGSFLKMVERGENARNR